MLQNLSAHIPKDKIAVIYHGIDKKLLEEGGIKLPQINAIWSDGRMAQVTPVRGFPAVGILALWHLHPVGERMK